MPIPFGYRGSPTDDETLTKGNFTVSVLLLVFFTILTVRVDRIGWKVAFGIAGLLMLASCIYLLIRIRKNSWVKSA